MRRQPVAPLPWRRDEPIPPPTWARRGAARLEPRAVLRPRLRARGHPGLASAPRRPHLAGRGSRDPCPARRLVGVDLHDLGHEHARPRLGRRATARARDHVRQSRDGRRDPRGVRQPGTALRRRVRGDSGGKACVPHLRRGFARLARAATRRPHPHLVRRLGRVLARRCPRVGPGAHRAVARRTRDRLRGTSRPLPSARAAAARPVGLGRRDLALRGTLPALRDHRSRRVDRRHGCDDVRAAARPRADGRLRPRVPLDRGAVVAVLRLTSPRSPNGASSSRTTARS